MEFDFKVNSEPQEASQVIYSNRKFRPSEAQSPIFNYSATEYVFAVFRVYQEFGMSTKIHSHGIASHFAFSRVTVIRHELHAESPKSFDSNRISCGEIWR